MTTQLHLASQYLAAAGISFVAKKEDDSHTNLGFSIENASLYTRNLNDQKGKLSLNYDAFALEWKNQDKIDTLKLDGTSHSEVIQWIQRIADANNLGTYTYNFHYDLPYKVSEDPVFKLEDANKLQELKTLRILAHRVLKKFLGENNLHSEIRIWPHHFDTGAFAPLEDESGLSIGLGMAIPDTVIDNYYFYISGYHGHDSIETSGFNTLSNGEWKTEGFKGAVLPVIGINIDQGVKFFNEAFQAYQM